MLPSEVEHYIKLKAFFIAHVSATCNQFPTCYISKSSEHITCFVVTSVYCFCRRIEVLQCDKKSILKSDIEYRIKYITVHLF